MRMLKGLKSDNMIGKICSISFVFFLSRISFTKYPITHTIKQITNQKCKNIAILQAMFSLFNPLSMRIEQ